MTNIQCGSSSTIHEVSLALNRAETIQSTLCSIVQNVTKEMNAKGCCFAVYTPDRRFLRHVVCYGLSEQYVTKGLMSADKSIAEALEGRAAQIPDATRDDRIQYPDKARQEGIVSILAVPVLWDGEVLGVIRVYTAALRRFSEQDIDFVRTAGNMGAKALADAANSDGLRDTSIDIFRQQLLEMEWGHWPGSGQCPGHPPGESETPPAVHPRG